MPRASKRLVSFIKENLEKVKEKDLEKGIHLLYSAGYRAGLKARKTIKIEIRSLDYQDTK